MRSQSEAEGGFSEHGLMSIGCNQLPEASTGTERDCVSASHRRAASHGSACCVLVRNTLLNHPRARSLSAGQHGFGLPPTLPTKDCQLFITRAPPAVLQTSQVCRTLAAVPALMVHVHVRPLYPGLSTTCAPARPCSPTWPGSPAQPAPAPCRGQTPYRGPWPPGRAPSWPARP
jgi:hypothetical protein